MRLVQPLAHRGGIGAGVQQLERHLALQLRVVCQPDLAWAPRPSSRSSSKRPSLRGGCRPQRAAASGGLAVRAPRWHCGCRAGQRQLGRCPAAWAARAGGHPSRAAGLQRRLQVAQVQVQHAVRSAAPPLQRRAGTCAAGQGQRLDGFVGTAGHGAQHVVVALGHCAPGHPGGGAGSCAAPCRPGPSSAPRHCPDGFDVHPQHGKGGASSLMPGSSGSPSRGRWARLHQPLDLLGLVRKVVLHDQAAQVLQQRDQVDHLAVVTRGRRISASRPARLQRARSGAAVRPRRPR
jgi:hypothetical protein